MADFACLRLALAKLNEPATDGHLGHYVGSTGALTSWLTFAALARVVRTLTWMRRMFANMLAHCALRSKPGERTTATWRPARAERTEGSNADRPADRHFNRRPLHSPLLLATLPYLIGKTILSISTPMGTTTWR